MISADSSFPNFYIVSELGGAYSHYISFLAFREQDDPPEPPQKKQKVASKKAAAVKENVADKRAAEPSASARSSPPSVSEHRSKQLQDRPSRSIEASGHVSYYFLCETFEYSNGTRYLFDESLPGIRIFHYCLATAYLCCCYRSLRVCKSICELRRGKCSVEEGA